MFEKIGQAKISVMSFSMKGSSILYTNNAVF